METHVLVTFSGDCTYSAAHVAHVSEAGKPRRSWSHFLVVLLTLHAACYLQVILQAVKLTNFTRCRDSVNSVI